MLQGWAYLSALPRSLVRGANLVPNLTSSGEISVKEFRDVLGNSAQIKNVDVDKIFHKVTYTASVEHTRTRCMHDQSQFPTHSTSLPRTHVHKHTQIDLDHTGKIHWHEFLAASVNRNEIDETHLKQVPDVHHLPNSIRIN